MSQRALYIALFVSLALNLFVLGAGAGVYLADQRARQAPPPRNLPPMMAAAAVLPQDQREAYRDALNLAAATVRPNMREARRLRHDAWIRLGADPLDTQGIVADLDKARTLQADAQGQVDRRIIDYAARMPPAQRKAMGAVLAEPPQRRGDRAPPPPQP